jgi:hypothetical protein
MRSLGIFVEDSRSPKKIFRRKCFLRNLFALLCLRRRKFRKNLIFCFPHFFIGVMWRVKNPPAAVAENPSTPDSRNPGDDCQSVSVSLGVSIKYICKM